MAIKIQMRRGTAAEWTTANPVLAAGEAGLETDTGIVRYGDGVTAWAGLSAHVPLDVIGPQITALEEGKADAASVDALTPAIRERVVGGPSGPVSVRGCLNVQAFGAVGDNVTDDTTAFQDAWDTAYTFGFGELYAPGTEDGYYIPGQLNAPNDGAADPAGRALRIRGDGAWMAGRGHKSGHAPKGGTILRMTYAGEYAKILTLGQGLLEMTGITFLDDSGATTPFIKTTGTTLHIHHCAFIGSKLRTTCDQDVIILGGANIGVDDMDNTPDGPFQGYGTVITQNYFDKIRCGVKLQMFANSVVVENNTFWAQCGDNTNGTTAAIDLNPPPTAGGQSVFGNVVSGNLIEMLGYTYGIRLERASANMLAGNSFFDGGVNALACIYAASVNARYNTIIAGFNGGGGTPLPYLVEQTDGTNTLIDGNQGGQSRFVYHTRFERAIRAYGTGEASTNNIEFSDVATKAVFTAQGTKWKREGTGGQLDIDTGTGGSNLNLRGFGVRFYDHHGALRITAMATRDGFAFGAAADVNLYRRTTDQLRTDNKLLTLKGLGVGNSVAATTPGAVVGKVPLWNADGDTILGYLPLYDAIT